MKNLILFAVLAVIATSCCCGGNGCGYEDRYCTTPVCNNPAITRDAGGGGLPGVAY